MSNYQIRFMVIGDSGSFQFEYSFDPVAWHSANADHNKLVWDAAKTSVAGCFRPDFQHIHFLHRVKQEVEFEVSIEPNYTHYPNYSDWGAVENQPDSLKIFWGKKRTFVVKTVLYPESIEAKSDS